VGKTARNARCPCGSGRKYKHCCLREEERLEQQAREEERVGRSISDWSVEQFGDELARAFDEFHPESHRIEERDFALLLTWFISDRELSAGGGTPLERYLARSDLDSGEREVAERIAAARLGLHRVRTVTPGRSVELEDILTGASIVAASESVSREVVCWDLVLCRVMPGRPLTLWGPVLVYAPDEEPELRAELDRLADVFRLPHDPVGLGEVFRLAGRQLNRFVPPRRLAEPSYFTAEGDPLVAARAVWSLVDPEDAFRVLDAPLELLWVGESEDGSGECFQLTGDGAELLAGGPRCRRTRSSSRAPTQASRTGSGSEPSSSTAASSASMRSPSQGSSTRSSSSRIASPATPSSWSAGSARSTSTDPSRQKRSSLPAATCSRPSTWSSICVAGWTSRWRDSKG
jgi:hypothetical protein